MANVTGLRHVVAMLARSEKRTHKRMVVGITKGCLYLQRVSQKVVPVDTGNLRASAFTRVEEPTVTRVVGTVGYTAAYAIYVHENLNARHKPGKTAKFLEGPAREESKVIARIIREEMEG